MIKTLRLNQGLSQKQLGDHGRDQHLKVQLIGTGADASVKTLKCLTTALTINFSLLRKD
jgi:hypothetical protein